jgi:hypothetical protein
LRDLTNSIRILGTYSFRQEHNLFAGYTATFINSRGGLRGHGGGVIHNFDLGDDYFSLFRIQLSPTTTISASTGLSLNTGQRGPGIANRSSLAFIKLWETAVFSTTYSRGLTTSLGLGGASETTTVSSGFNIRLTERLGALVGVDYSFFDAEGADFKVLRAGAGLQYWFTEWLSSSLLYRHQRRDAGQGAGVRRLVHDKVLSSSGEVSSHDVLAALVFHFDIWPNAGLSKAAQRELYSPVAVPFSFPTEPGQFITPPTPPLAPPSSEAP